MRKKILITGGAGFIGKKLSRKLLDLGAEVVVFDCLSEQVHGLNPELPDEFNGKNKFIRGNILNREEFKRVMDNVEIVIHLAAETGVGQSMYQIARYSETNIVGTANLLDILAAGSNNIKKIILASSRAIYGEGSYSCGSCGEVNPIRNEENEIQNTDWELKCPDCAGKISPLPINENCLPNPVSIYAVSKHAQEKLVELAGQSLKVPYTILRFFNVYGEGQSLNNPYTGILSTFISRILNKKPLRIFEDGLMSRDFVYIDDVVDAIIASMENASANNKIYNVGSAGKITILGIAETLRQIFDSKVKFEITGFHRCGDVRHVVADISKISAELGFYPKYKFRDGIERYVEWAAGQNNVVDASDKALRELQERTLLRT